MNIYEYNIKDISVHNINKFLRQVSLKKTLFRIVEHKMVYTNKYR